MENAKMLRFQSILYFSRRRAADGGINWRDGTTVPEDRLGPKLA